MELTSSASATSAGVLLSSRLVTAHNSGNLRLSTGDSENSQSGNVIIDVGSSANKDGGNIFLEGGKRRDYKKGVISPFVVEMVLCRLE